MHTDHLTLEDMLIDYSAHHTCSEFCDQMRIVEGKREVPCGLSPLPFLVWALDAACSALPACCCGKGNLLKACGSSCSKECDASSVSV